MRPIVLILWCCFCLMIGCPTKGMAKQVYGIELNDSIIKFKTDSLNKKFFNEHYLLKNKKKYVSEVQLERHFVNPTTSFYLVLLLLLLLGVIKSVFPAYFANLFKAFLQPSSSKRQLQDQLDMDSAANLAMNFFFCISFGFFLYAIFAQKTTDLSQFKYPPFIILCLLISLLALTYLVKYILLKFLGWTFRITDITEDYSFNVLLINKIIGVVILPFAVILAFGKGDWLNIVFILSIVVLTILVLNRYVRSWSSLGSFFQYSKFHFFTYFCAAELLPLLILLKLVRNWLM